MRKDSDENVFDEIVGSKAPAVFTVFLEDSASLIGSALALLGIFLGITFRNPYFYLDPIASILIGILLAAVALFLGKATGALLIGERTNRARIRKLRQIFANDPAVERIGKDLNHATRSATGPTHRKNQVSAHIQPATVGIRNSPDQAANTTPGTDCENYFY
jgi:divalent metal cation (Fe/Co/Zn/Cd) transporter